MRPIKYRQPQFVNGVFASFHYWGFKEEGFMGPLTGRHLVESQQFTGLLDKNGKEIYEGDIVKRDGWDKPYDWIWNIEWLNEEARYEPRLQEHNEYEIIGNIYEPKLLNTNN